jgi:AhpD family alkylhydroperoxidase
MKTNLFLGASLAILVVSAAPLNTASAQEAPQWMKQTYPEQALKFAVEEQKAVFNPKGALDAKEKHLIGLGVAAQIPCEYCVYVHTQAAKQAGATDAEIKEAVAAAALTRKWSTVLNGSAYDFGKFKQQVNAQYTGH